MIDAMKSALTKVPAVTLGFWIIKILATTFGETAGDTVSMSMNLGYLVGTAIFASILVLLVAMQIRAKQFHPFLYWATIIASTTAGTTMADFATRSMGIGYPGGSLLLLALVLASLAIWHRALGSISVQTVHEPKAELYYWLTITFSQTLGTALGDWVADGSLGYLGAAVVFGGRANRRLLKVQPQRDKGMKARCATAVDKGRPARCQHAKRRFQLIDRAEPQAGRRASCDTVGSLPISFGAEQQPRRDLPGHRYATGPIVAIAGAGIDRIAPAAKRRPGSGVLLHPDREQRGHLAIAHVVAGGGQGQPGKGRDRKPGSFVMIEAIFRRHLQIPCAPMTSSGVMHEGDGDADGELQIGRRAIVDLDPRRPAIIRSAPFDLKDRAIDFPMAGVGRFGIVGQERRPGPGHRRQTKAQRRKRRERASIKPHGRTSVRPHAVG